MNIEPAYYVGNIPTPKEYQNHWFMDMEIDGEPVGQDPETGFNVYWGDGHHVSCPIEDSPVNQDIPF